MYGMNAPETFVLDRIRQMSPAEMKRFFYESRSIGYDEEVAEASAIVNRRCNGDVEGEREHECHHGGQCPYRYSTVAPEQQQESPYEFVGSESECRTGYEGARNVQSPHSEILGYLYHTSPRIDTFDEA